MLKYIERTLNKGKGVHRQDSRGNLVTIHNWRVHYSCNVAVCSCLCMWMSTSLHDYTYSSINFFQERVLCHSINWRG